MAEARSIHSFFLTAPNQHRPFCDLAGRTAQPCPSPALCALFPHPLQNRVPRVQVLLPLPQTRRKHCVSAGFLFACVAWEWGSFWFKLWLFAPGFTRFQLFPSPPAPKIAPGFGCFRLKSGAFFLFRCFLGAKFLSWFLCTLLHSVYKLKPSVIPCKREVSFFT